APEQPAAPAAPVPASPRGGREEPRRNQRDRAGGDGDGRGKRFAGKMHLSDSGRARRSSGAGARGRGKSRRHPDQARTGTGFTRPTAPIVREVEIGETITVADLAQQMALKGGEVVKALFKMGVMATITQSI